MFGRWSRRTKVLVGVGLALLVVVVIVLAVVLQPDQQQPSKYLGAIATDAAPCQEVGERLLRAGGNAVDVTIGILFCEGVSSAQSMGLGGGFLMTIYDRKNKKSYVLNSREEAPAAATEGMFGNNTDRGSLYGSKGIAVPAELVGYWRAHERFGKLPWATIVEPTIQLCEDGVHIIQYQENIMRSIRTRILASPTLSALLVDPVTNDVKRRGDVVKRPQLAETLRVVAREGGLALHRGSLTQRFVKDLNDFGSIVTAEDLGKFEPKWDEPTEANLPGGFRLISVPPPGSGPLLAHFLMLTAGMVEAPLRTADQYQLIIEAMKFVYAARTDFGDQAFVPSAIEKSAQLLNQTFVDEIRAKIRERATQTSTDPRDYGASWATADSKGTAHVATITEDFAVSVTSTVNTEYGCMLVSPSTGIILNNEMDDFSLPGVNSFYGVPPSEANFIRPGKKPQSSMSPSVIVDADGDVRLIIGASGGTRIPSAAGLVAFMHLYLGVDLDEAIATKRIHHQLMPMAVQLELGYPEDLRAEFARFGHQTTNLSRTASSVMAIAVNGNDYHPSADVRREGVTALILR